MILRNFVTVHVSRFAINRMRFQGRSRLLKSGQAMAGPLTTARGFADDKETVTKSRSHRKVCIHTKSR